jgi:hypothetical protein
MRIDKNRKKCCIVICTLNQYLPLIGTIKLLLLLLLLLFNMFIYMKVGHSKFVEMHGDAYDFCRSALVFYTQQIQHFMPDSIRDNVRIYTIHINITYDNNNPLF